MKYLNSILLPTVLLLLVYGCETGKKVNLESPDATFQTMVNAIQAQDIDTYSQCWHPDRANNDGLALRLKTEPELWKGLQQKFHNDGERVARSEGEIDGHKVSTYEVITPGIENGDRINSVALTEVNGEWKMYHW